MSQLPLKLNWQEKSANGSTPKLDHTVMCELLYFVPPGVVMDQQQGYHLETLRKAFSNNPPHTTS